MECLGLEPGAAGWKVQTNPLCYGGTPKKHWYLHSLWREAVVLAVKYNMIVGSTKLKQTILAKFYLLGWVVSKPAIEVHLEKTS